MREDVEKFLGIRNWRREAIDKDVWRSSPKLGSCTIGMKET